MPHKFHLYLIIYLWPPTPSFYTKYIKYLGCISKVVLNLNIVLKTVLSRSISQKSIVLNRNIDHPQILRNFNDHHKRNMTPPTKKNNGLSLECTVTFHSPKSFCLKKRVLNRFQRIEFQQKFVERPNCFVTLRNDRYMAQLNIIDCCSKSW